MSGLPEKSAFFENLSSCFLVHTEEGKPIELELVELKEGSSNSRVEQFALVFRGSNRLVLPQQIYQLLHDRLGEFELFLVPLGRDAHGSYYEAVFNRFIQN